MRDRFLIPFMLIVPYLLSYCDDIPGPTICTAEFVTLRITVVDTSGFPVDSVEILVYNSESGKIYDVSDMNIWDSHLSRSGSYTVYHDGFIKPYQGIVERLIVEGEKGESGFRIEYAVSNNECHVYKLSGPDTVVIR